MEVDEAIGNIIKSVFEHFGLKDSDFEGNTTTSTQYAYLNVIKARSLLNQGKYAESISMLNSWVDAHMGHYPSGMTIKVLEDGKVFGDRIKMYHLFRSIKILRFKYENTDHKRMLDNLKDSPIFDEGEANIKTIPMDVYGLVEDAINSNLISVGLYKDSGDKIPDGVQYIITPEITVSTTITGWMENLSSMSTEDGVVQLSLFLRMDEVSVKHYSSFYLGIQYKNTVWVATDQLTWQNPRNKNSSRRPDKRKEDHYQKIWLPYGIAHHITEIRKSQTGVVKGNVETIDITFVQKDHYHGADEIGEYEWDFGHATQSIMEGVGKALSDRGYEVHAMSFTKGSFHDPSSLELKKDGKIMGYVMPPGGSFGDPMPKSKSKKLTYKAHIYTSPEVLKVPLKKTLPMERAFTLLLFQRLVENLRDGNIKPRSVVSPNMHINQKLLSGETIDVMDDNNMRFDEASKLYVAEVMEGYEVEPDSAIVKASELGIVKTMPEYSAEILSTVDVIDGMIPWFPAEKTYQEITKKIQMKAGGGRRGRYGHSNELQDMFVREHERVAKIVTIAKKGVYLSHEDLHNVSFSSLTSRDKKHSDSVTLISRILPKELRKKNHFPGYNNHFNLGGKPKEDYCDECYDSLAKPAAIITINHWSHMVFWLGIKNRMELPMYYRSYRIHNYVPYNGNSILDHVHPMSLIKDPLSQDIPNGIEIGFALCGNCLWGKIAKKPNFVIIDKDLNVLWEGDEEPDHHQKINAGK